MKIKIKEWMRDPEEVDLFSFISAGLSGDDPEKGELETMQAEISNLRRAVAMLLSLLVEKQVISVEVALKIASQWWSNNDKVVAFDGGGKE